MHEKFPQLPRPGAEALASSDALRAHIRAEIAAAGGWIGFARYMELVLYAPGLGYYSAGSTKFGAHGDFVTAPELGDTLAKALAAQLVPALAALEEPVLIELGAGLGSLAEQLLEALEAGGAPQVPYWILEPSADLKARQIERLRRWQSRVRWLDGLPECSWQGFILANEVVDALPAARFVKRGGHTLPMGVVSGPDGGFMYAEGEEDGELSRVVAILEAALGTRLPDGYCSEIRLQLRAWVAALAHGLHRGGLWFIDYGYARRDYYREERSSGTSIGHYRHRALDDPFFLPGLVDLSAWVDFSALADAGHACGCELAGYTTQGQFLLQSLSEGLIVPGTSPEALSAFKTLILPGEMGERFKLMLLTKDFAAQPMPGRDFRDRLR